MPLIRQYWLARKDRNRVALKPVVDRKNQRVDFEVAEGPNVTGNPAEATTSRGDTRCLLCGQVVKAAQVRQIAINGKMSATLTSVILNKQPSKSKSYREDKPDDWKAYESASDRLRVMQEGHQGEYSFIPDEPIDPKTLGLRVDAYGLDQWAKLFNCRQLLTLTCFARLVGEAHTLMLNSGTEPEYAKAITTCLGLVADKAAGFGSTLCILNAEGGRGVLHTFARQALPMVWDYAESNPFCEQGAGWRSYMDRTIEALEDLWLGTSHSSVAQRDARIPSLSNPQLIVTDPPYYDAIDYAGLSDFFYVWLKRSIGFLDSELFSLPLTPKSQQAIMASEGNDAGERQRYVDAMTQAFEAMAQSIESNGTTGIVFAHSNPDAWATLIEGLLGASLVPEASWPIDTEREGKVSNLGHARLKTSVWMVCRKREDAAAEAFLGDVLEAMRPVVRERLLYFWGKGIRGADFFISAIGPALSVFGRYQQVLRPDGTAVSVRDFLDIVRRESTTVALEQVLHGADLGVIDPVTRQYVTWVWSYSRAPLDAGEAIALCLATGATYADTIRPSSIGVEGREKSKKVVRLRTIRQRAAEDDDLGFGTSARPVPLIDQLQYAAWLWGQTRTRDLGSYRGSLGETRWEALRTLGQAVAECLPDGDEDRRIINGLLGSGVMASAPPDNGRPRPPQPAGAQLPGFETEEEDGSE